ncbi:hypothetical protein [Pedobacter sp.]
MKNLTFVALLFLLFAACGKQEISKQEEETATTPLNISRVIFSINSILQKKQTSTHVALRYWKEENISASDDVSLTINGTNITPIKKTSHNALTGSDALFQIPALNVSGEIKVTYTIKSGNKTYSGEKILRYVNDYSIATVWDKLNKDYVLENPHMLLIDKDGSFQVNGGTVTPEPANLGISMYGNIRSMAISQVLPPLISGLNGGYSLRYDNNRSLNAIVITLGNENADQSFDKNKTLEDITAVYGNSSTNIVGNKVYSSGIFDIEVSTSGSNLVATIKKVR